MSFFGKPYCLLGLFFSIRIQSLSGGEITQFGEGRDLLGLVPRCACGVERLLKLGSRFVIFATVSQQDSPLTQDFIYSLVIALRLVQLLRLVKTLRGLRLILFALVDDSGTQIGRSVLSIV